MSGSKNGAPVVAVQDLTLEVPPGRVFTLLGPSGCGKTTVLRCIAGLESPDAGEIVVDGRVFFSSRGRRSLTPAERGVGMVFQSYAIWPHMNVFDNVAFPLVVRPRATRPTRAEINERVVQTLETVRLGNLATRRATDLSGGQQQRLALARALVMEPPLLLLDEPLSNLDANLREDMRLELKRLQRDVGVTSVYVTHDQVEALAMSDLIGVMNHGALVQVGTPREIYDQPASRFVAEFIGTSNLIDGVIHERNADDYVVRTEAGELVAASKRGFTIGQRVVVSVRPEHVKLQTDEVASTNGSAWHGEVLTRGFLGESVDHLVDVSGLEIRVRCNPSDSIPPGARVTVVFPAHAPSLVPMDPGIPNEVDS